MKNAFFRKKGKNAKTERKPLPEKEKLRYVTEAVLPLCNVIYREHP